MINTYRRMYRFIHLLIHAGELLEHLGVHVEPKQVVARIPEGMAIPHLKERLVRIMHDFRTQASLREGCNTILSRDCTLLAQVPVSKPNNQSVPKLSGGMEENGVLNSWQNKGWSRQSPQRMGHEGTIVWDT